MNATTLTKPNNVLFSFVQLSFSGCLKTACIGLKNCI